MMGKYFPPVGGLSLQFLSIGKSSDDVFFFFFYGLCFFSESYLEVLSPIQDHKDLYLEGLPS